MKYILILFVLFSFGCLKNNYEYRNSSTIRAIGVSLGRGYRYFLDTENHLCFLIGHYKAASIAPEGCTKLIRKYSYAEK